LKGAWKGEGSKAVGQTPGGRIDPQPAATVLLAANPVSPAARLAGTATIAMPGAQPPVQTIPKESARPASHAWRNAAATCVLLGVIVLGAVGIVRRDNALGIARRYNALGIVRRYKILAVAIHPDSTQNVNAGAPVPPADPLPDAASETPADTPIAAVQSSTPAEPSGTATPTAGVTTSAGASGPLPKAASASLDSDSLDANEDPARQEQTLWDKAMAYLQAGDLDDAETSLRDILTLPQGGHRWAEAAHYVDQAIPERRQDEKLWAAAQLESTARDPGHLLREIKALDELLAIPGAHKREARPMRDTVIIEVIHEDARRNQMEMQAASEADQWQMTRLKNHLDELVEKGDAAALDELQELGPKFKSIGDAQGPLAMDARDYLNSVVPKAQKHIEERLAAAKSNSSANATYLSAVKAYSRAVAAENSAALRDQVLPLFSQMAQSGGARAREAQRYAEVLVPAALKKSGRQDQ